MTVEKVSLIITVLNEEKTIHQLLTALSEQTYPFDELIITDGGSTDKTATIVEDFLFAHPDFKLQFIEVSGNRSIGRNEAIELATSKCIAITDAGCVPHKNWLEELVNKYQPNSVVAGYYDAKPKTGFEEAVVPYVLVMPDRVDPKTFLPATRSVLMDKDVWEKVGRFDERLTWNEDYEFAQRLVKNHIKIIFAENAKVTWIPRQNLSQFWKMIWHFAMGDVQAGIWRRKVLFIFGRYLVAALALIVLLYLDQPIFLGFLFLIGLLFYSTWAILKNHRYVKKGLFWLPILQISSDFAVMGGSLAGLVN